MSDGGGGAAVHPEIWALTELAAGAGVPLDAAAALGGSGGAGLIAVGFRDTRAELSTLHLSGWNPFQTSLLGGIERLGLHAVVGESSRRRRALKHLDRALDGGGPVAVWVDGATLGLGPEALAGASPTVVVARSRADGRIDVSDRPGDPLTVDRDQLDVARAANPAHRARVATIVPGKTADPAVAQRRGLAATAVGPLGGPPGVSGPDALHLLADLLADGSTEPGSFGSEFPDDAAVRTALIALHLAGSREGGLLREHQAAFTAQAADGLDLPALRAQADAYRELAAGWRAVGEAALPADVPALAALRGAPSAWELPPGTSEEPFPLSATELRELLDSLAARLSALADREHDVLEALRATLSS